MLHRTELTTAQSFLLDRGSQWFNSVSRLESRQSLYPSPASQSATGPHFYSAPGNLSSLAVLHLPLSHQSFERRISRIARACMSFPTDHEFCSSTPNSLSCSSLTSVGAPVNRQTAFCVLGKAIVSRISSRPSIFHTIRSNPRASPACGGGP